MDTHLQDMYDLLDLLDEQRDALKARRDKLARQIKAYEAEKKPRKIRASANSEKLLDIIKVCPGINRHHLLKKAEIKPSQYETAMTYLRRKGFIQNCGTRSQPLWTAL